MGTKLGKWFIEEYGEKKTKTASEWRAGITKGSVHPKNTPELREKIGREQLIREARILEDAGLIKVKWTQVRTDFTIIHFQMENLDRLYEYEGITNPKTVIQQQKTLLEEWLKDIREDWLANYYSSILKQIVEGKKRLDEKETQVLRCVYELARLQEYQFKRKFSEKVFHDSKKLEKEYEKRVITVLKKAPQIIEGMQDYEILAEFKILTYSQTLAIKGNLTYSIDDTFAVNTSNMPYGTILNAQTLVHGKPIVTEGVRRVITIENQANYEDMKYDDHTLYVFVHGFPSPKERNFLRHIADIAEEGTEFYHWSDMDLGGIRIYRFLKQNLFPALQPMNMNAENYLNAIKDGHGIDYDNDKKIKYEELYASGECPEELKALLELILTHGKDIEQEGVSPI